MAPPPNFSGHESNGAARAASSPKTAGSTLPIRKGKPKALAAAKTMAASKDKVSSVRLPFR